jgi:hypothetical protein
MSLTKNEKILVSIVIILVVFAVNFASHYIIKSKLNISIYNAEYVENNKKFFKNSDTKVHPYYGLDTGDIRGFESNISEEKSFISVSPTLSDQPIKILVLGGSVASHLSLERLDVPKHLLSKKLNKHFETDRFTVYNAAFGGGKQPQQYLKLLYLELLGFKPDVIINYDGFNEVALPLGENFDRNLNAIYPRSFDQTVAGSVYDGDCFTLNNFLISFNSYIPIIELPKLIYIRSCHNRAVPRNPILGFSDDDSFAIEKAGYVQRTLSIWAQSSNRIENFAKQMSIPYLHFLQPVQYLEGSKNLTITEKSFSNYALYQNPLRKHYAKLDMSELNTKFKYDHRYLFLDETRTVYSDNSSHMNYNGMNSVIEDIIKQGNNVFMAKMLN